MSITFPFRCLMSAISPLRNPGHPRKSSKQKMSVCNPSSLAMAPMCVADAPRKLPSSIITRGRTSSIRRRNTVLSEPQPLIRSGCRSAATSLGGKPSNGETPSKKLSMRNFRAASGAIASALHSVWNVIRRWFWLWETQVR